MSKNADYAQIAPRYNNARPIERKDTDFWIMLVSNTIQGRKIKLLDLGCGNGRFSIPFAEKLGYSVTGVDSSHEMLLQAQKNDKEHLVTWERQSADALTYDDNSFDAVFISHLLHLVDNPKKVLEEIYRVLVPGGVFIDRYASLEDNLAKPERKFFPELADLDRTIIPTQKEVESWMKEVGFHNINSQTLSVPTFDSGNERVERAKQRAESGLTKISDKAFSTGINMLTKYINKHPNESWILNEVYTVTTAKK